MDDTSLVPINLDTKKTVKKSNVLNELRNASASLVEYRLFCVYLAHLPLNSENNIVTFTLADYARIAGLKRPRKEDLEAQAENLVSMTAKIDTPDGGFRKFPLFAEFKLYRQDNQWMVSLECNPKIAPMIREQKGKFLRYKLYNTIFLKSYNQQRLYELLKQYERIGERTITLLDLREFLSIGDNEYSVWGDFSQKVLKVSQRALKENTDICFEYEPIKKGRPVVAVKFIIRKNKGFVDRLLIEQHLPDAGEADNYDGDEMRKRAQVPEEQTSPFDPVTSAEPICRKLLPKLTDNQIREIAAAAMGYFAALLPTSVVPSETQIGAYLAQKISVLDAQRKKQSIPYPARYLATMIRTDTERVCQDKRSDDPFQRELRQDEIDAIQQMMSESDEPVTVGNDPELAARAAALRDELQQK